MASPGALVVDFAPAGLAEHLFARWTEGIALALGTLFADLNPVVLFSALRWRQSLFSPRPFVKSLLAIVVCIFFDWMIPVGHRFKLGFSLIHFCKTFLGSLVIEKIGQS